MIRIASAIVVALGLVAATSTPGAAQGKVCYDTYEPCTEDWECNKCIGDYPGAARDVTCKEVNNVCPGGGGTYISPICNGNTETACWDVPDGFPVIVGFCSDPDASEYGLTCEGTTPGVCGTEVACVDLVRRLPGLCSGGPFDGGRCAENEDCNVCDGYPTAESCLAVKFSNLAYNTGWDGICPAVGGTCQDGVTECYEGDDPFCEEFGGGGPCTGLTASSCQQIGVCKLPDLLPVEFTAFTATTHGSTVILDWQTASEENNAGFAIEYSTVQDASGPEWTRAGFVDGAGTTVDPQVYRFALEGLSVGRHEIRLKQIDLDGTFEFSETLEAVVEVPAAYVLEAPYPNPFNPSTTIRFAVAIEQRVRVTVTNAAGQAVRTLFSGTVPANEMRQLTFDAGGLSSGTYFVHLEGGAFSATEHLVLAK